MNQSHPTALVESGVQLGPDVIVGPFAIIEAGAELGPGCVVEAHARIRGCVRLGARNRVATGALLGGPAQHRQGSRHGGVVIIGDDNTFGEYSTVHQPALSAVTRLGHRNFLMAYVHIGHDCVVGNGNTLANGVQLGGHAVLGDRATLGLMAVVHQFVRIGDLAMVAALSMVQWDVPPYAAVEGRPARIRAVNKVGLGRAEVDAEVVRELRIILREHRRGVPDPQSEEAHRLCQFLQAPSQRGIAPWHRDKR